MAVRVPRGNVAVAVVAHDGPAAACGHIKQAVGAFNVIERMKLISHIEVNEVVKRELVARAKHGAQLRVVDLIAQTALLGLGFADWDPS